MTISPTTPAATSPATSNRSTPDERHRPQRPTAGQGVNFGRILRSEWIKVTTVPSTVILIGATVVVMIGLAALSAWALTVTAQAFESAATPGANPAPPGALDSAIFDPAVEALAIPPGGLIFGQLLIASLAVVLIASEWTTGMIRSTMVAVPKRTPALLAKTVIVAAIAFVVGLVSALLSYLIAQPVLAGENLDFALTEDGVLASVVNTGTFLAFVAIISMSIGILLRNTAGGVVTAVGIFFVLPLIVPLLAGIADWIPDAARFLPGDAGLQMVAVTTAEDALTQWEGGLAMGAWALLLLVVALVVAKKRDV